MNLNRILSHIRNSWRTLAICAVVGLLLGGLATAIQKPTYEAKSTVLVSPNGLGNVGPALGADAYFIAQRAQSYVDLVTSRDVLIPAGQKAGVANLQDADVNVTWVSTAPANLTISVKRGTAHDAAASANAIAEQLTTFIANKERPSNGGVPVVRLSVARTATDPKKPISPNLPVYLLLGLVAGLVIGFPLIFAPVLVRRGITDADALTEATGEPPLGVIESAPVGVGLIMRDAAGSNSAEAFRKLRTAVQFAKPDSATRSIVVTSAQVGAGASTVAANLACAAAESGRRVVLVDANLRAPSVGEALRVSTALGLANVLAGDVDLAAALQPTNIPGLAVLAAGHGPGQSGSVLATAAMVRLLEQLEEQADLVIIDAPPVLPYAEAAELAAIADAALLVARHGRTSVTDVRQARATLTQVGTTVLGVVINAIPSRTKPTRATTRPPAGFGPRTQPPAQPQLTDHPTQPLSGS
ncbi:MAG: polysaccharide biosynthesis tyrosine autokinase [Mycobacteriales bacterium]